MSGIFKSIGRVFKKIVRTVKKIALPALAIGAIVLTGGAALGALPAVSSVLGGLGLSAGVTSALTTAVTTAGYGGAIGLATGGTKGMVKGATAGFIGGGLLGAANQMGRGAGAVANVAQRTAQGDIIPGATSAADIPRAGDVVSIGDPNLVQPQVPQTAGVPGVAQGGVSSLAQGLLASPVIGQVLSGLGAGVSAKAAAKEDRRILDERRANYDMASSPLTTGLLAQYQPAATDPTDAFSQTGQWVYDERLGRLVKRSAA